MSREKVLEQLGFPLPGQKLRMIIDTDAKNEADDQFAIIHHLLSPMLDVRGITASHFESKAKTPGETMEKSYQEILKILKLAQMEEIPAYRGCTLPLRSEEDAATSEAVEFIIEEARREEAPLYIAVLGTMTNIAAALNHAPDIAYKLIVLWNGGGPYPAGRREFNLMQDIYACRVLLKSQAQVWQIPQNVYGSLEVTLAELAQKVHPCGELGAYLFSQLVEQNLQDYNPNFLLRTGENWTLGDNSTVAVLLMNRFRGNWHEQRAPIIQPDMTYGENPEGKYIRVYDSIDVRMTLNDLFAKLALAYGS